MAESVLFSAGSLVLVDASGALPQSKNVGLLKNVEATFESAIKSYFGKKKFAVANATGECKVSGSIGFGHIDGALIASVLGGTKTSGRKLVENKTGLIPATPFTVTMAHAADFVRDLGVEIDGKTATLVASAPAAGQYSVAAGVYTFAGADTGKSYDINAEYTAVTGSTIKISNAQMGSDVVFELDMWNDFRGSHFGLKLYQVILPNLGLKFGNDEFTAQDLKWEANVNAVGDLGELYLD